MSQGGLSGSQPGFHEVSDLISHFRQHLAKGHHPDRTYAGCLPHMGLWSQTWRHNASLQKHRA